MAKDDKTTIDAPEVPAADAPAAPWIAPVATDVPAVPEAPAVDAPEVPVADAPAAPVIDKPEPKVQAEAAPTEETVTVTVPVGYELIVDHATRITVKPGTQEMALSHAQHWFSIANGVEIYVAK